MHMQRRRFVGLGLGAAALALTDISCGLITDPRSGTDARLESTPHLPSKTVSPGRRLLGIGGSRDGLLYVPQAASTGAAIPLLTLFHGATGSAENWDYLFPVAEGYGFAVLAPESRDWTWDYRGGFGPDVEFIDKALDFTFDRVKVDPGRIALGGFSDGGTYALSIGPANGDLFRRVMGFSPSVPTQLEARGKPPIFISHGTADPILPFETTRDVTVPHFRDNGYNVRFESFDGTHALPVFMARLAFDWWLAG